MSEEPGAEGAVAPGARREPAPFVPARPASTMDGPSGERFVPDEHRESVMEAEHLARYIWAGQIASGRTALDAGCGAGYGAAMLAAAGAAAVTGLDASAEAIEEAERTYGDVAGFVGGDLLALPFDPDSFDLVTCFEAIEHVRDPERALAEMARVLRPGGVLLISSPNRKTSAEGNPFHFFEWTDEEMDSALREVFGHVRLYRQTLELASIIGDESVLRAADPDRPLIDGVRKLSGREPGGEHFTLALAGESELPAMEPVGTLTGFRDIGAFTKAIRAWEKRARAAEAELAARENETSLALLAQQRSNLRLAELENKPLRRLGRLLRRRRGKVDIPRADR